MMKREHAAIDVKNLCSRKLWEIAVDQRVADAELAAITSELQLRRHYLAELEHQLQPRPPSRH
jgi:hypothetical protein